MCCIIPKPELLCHFRKNPHLKKNNNSNNNNNNNNMANIFCWLVSFVTNSIVQLFAG